MNILVTGGTGYIGSHTVVELLDGGHSVVVVDNLSNCSREVLTRIEEITGKSVPFYTHDIRDTTAMSQIFTDHSFDAVIHFAGLKAVGESTTEPLKYYDNNLGGTIALLQVMDQHNVRTCIFSSSATVYGSAPIPYTETSPAGTGISNPYGKTKYMIEEILRDVASAHPDSMMIALRYFNPIGAHESGRIGEDPNGIPNNLLPFIAQVAVGKRNTLHLFGDDYPTPDGTCIRDYVHVVDLARGHIAALKKTAPGFHVYNLGSGKGTSVMELIRAFEEATGRHIPYVVEGRRPGDLPEYYAKTDLASSELSWYAEKTIIEGCADTWRWQSQNPEGYATTK